MKIVSDFTGEPAWRGGVSFCPNCNWGVGLEYKETKKWDEAKNIREIVIRYDAPMQKASSIMISSECPKCFEISFLHHSFAAAETAAELFDWPKEIAKRIMQEKEERIKRGKERWKRSLCRICTVKKKVDWDYLYPCVSCNSGRHGGAETESCENFKKKRVKKSRERDII
jgi:hypothetical protein